MLTGRQIRDARAILHWNRNSLAKRSAVPVSVIQRAESDDGEADIALAHAIVIKHAFSTAGVEFIPENGEGSGVRLRKPPTTSTSTESQE